MMRNFLKACYFPLMTRGTRHCRFYSWTILLTCLCAHLAASPVDSIKIAQLRAAENARLASPDSAIQILISLHHEYLEEKDTIAAIRALVSLATVSGHMGQYIVSYNNLWKALMLADQADAKVTRAELYRRIGRYYAFYKRREKAFQYLDLALSLNKSLLKEGAIDSSSLSMVYAAYSYSYLNFGEPKSAQNYLDSCFISYREDFEGSIGLPTLKIRQAFLDIKSGHTKEAIQTIIDYLPWIEKTNPSLLVLAHNHLGDAYKILGNEQKAVHSYQTAISYSESLHSHVDFSPLIHEKLAKLYFDQKEYRMAYEELEKVQQLDRLIFDSRSQYNLPLLEIQDEFHKAMEAWDQLMQEKRIGELEHDNQIKILRNIIMSAVAGSIALFSILFFYYLRNKHRVEKKLINLEVQANKELIELKNRELAASTLKLVEKDKFLSELKNRISEKKGKISLHELNHLIKATNLGNVNNWKVFESQFIMVNNGFFKELRRRSPDLTEGERRLCALIRLKLSNREIAGLMGISVESVHKSRYRLRKKLGIERGQDLTDYIIAVG